MAPQFGPCRDHRKARSKSLLGQPHSHPSPNSAKAQQFRLPFTAIPFSSKLNLGKDKGGKR